MIESAGQYEIKGIVGLPQEVGQSVLGYEVLGADEHLPELIRECPNAILSLGQIRSASLRVSLYERLLMMGAHLPALAASTAVVSRHTTLGQGTVVMHGAIVNAGAAVGSNGIINSRALVEHDVRIADHCHVSTAAVLNGGVRVGERSFIGSGAVIHQNVRIGGGTIIGAGCIISRDVSDNSIVRTTPDTIRKATNT